MKIFPAALAAVFALCASAYAQDPPKTTDECLEIVSRLARNAEEKRFSDEDYKKLEDMLGAMEGQCDAQQFPEADASAKNIRQRLDAAS